jgi:hypothetical protein
MTFNQPKVSSFHRRLSFALLVAVAIAATASAQPARRTPRKVAPPPAPEAPSDVRVRSYLTQSAAWVGDPIDFVVEIDLAPGVEVVAADLAPEALVVEGLELGASQSSTQPRSDGWQTVTRTYRLTPWDITPPKRVAPITVRFRRPVTTGGTSADGATAAAEVVVPGATLAMRSTLPDDGSADGVRTSAIAAPTPAWIGWFRPVGLGLIALGIAPVVLWLATRFRRPAPSRPRPSSRSLRARLSSMFQELQIIDTSTPDGRRRAYDRLDADLRAYVTESEQVPALSLTANELRGRLSGKTRVPAETVCDALAECEVARYGPEDRVPAADALRATIERLESDLGKSRA